VELVSKGWAIRVLSVAGLRRDERGLEGRRRTKDGGVVYKSEADVSSWKAQRSSRCR